jgi:PAS domain S-box-containing protein
MNTLNHERVYLALREHGIDGMVIVDSDYLIRDANPQFIQLLKYSNLEVLSSKLNDLVFSADREKFELACSQSDSGKSITGVARFLVKDGSVLYFQYIGIRIDANFRQFIFHDNTENSKREEEHQARNREIIALYEISRQIASRVDIDQILETIVKNTLWLFECQFVSISIYDNENNRITYRAMVGNRTEWPRSTSYQAKKGMAGKVIPTNTVFIINDFPNDPQLNVAEFPQFQAEEIHSAVGVPLSYKGIVIGVLTTAYRKPHQYDQREIHLLAGIADQLVVAIEYARLYQSTVEHSRAMELLSARFTKIQEEERRKISRELHDSVGQALTALFLNLDLLNADIESKEHPAHDRIRAMKLIVDETLRDIRQIAFELRPAILDDFGIIPALRLFIHRFSRQSSVPITLKIPDKLPRRVPSVEAMLYRVVQEAISNISKHAKATHVQITLVADNDRVTLDMADNGVGFDATKFKHPEFLYGGLGLLSMRERVTELHGIIDIQSLINKGTKIHIEVPLINE